MLYRINFSRISIVGEAKDLYILSSLTRCRKNHRKIDIYTFFSIILIFNAQHRSTTISGLCLIDITNSYTLQQVYLFLPCEYWFDYHSDTLHNTPCSETISQQATIKYSPLVTEAPVHKRQNLIYII